MMHFGYSLSPFGHMKSAWRRAASKEALVFDTLLAQVLQAEAAGFDFVLVQDNNAKRPVDSLSPLATPFEPTTLVSALSTRTRKIGFLAAAAIAQHEPYNLARRFASLDLIGHGRGGWSIIRSDDSARDREYVEVVSALWDSWEDDAFIYDKAGSRFFRPEKMHVLNHKGEHFSVRGPLNVNRSPQGKPVLASIFSGEVDATVASLADVITIDDRTIVPHLVRCLGRQNRKRSDVRVLATVLSLPNDTHAAADDFQRQFETQDIDGFLIAPSDTALFSQLVEIVIPELRRRGLMRSDYSGKTLRDHLGLPVPVHPAKLEGRS